MEKIQTQDCFIPIDVSKRLPEQMFNTVNSGDSFKVAYFHKNAHISEQWTDDSHGRRLTFPTHWLEKHTDKFILSKEDIKKIISVIAYEAFDENVLMRIGMSEFLKSVDEKIDNLFK